MEHLGVIRINQNLSLRDLAERSGIAWVTIHAIERGRQVPQARSIRALSTALDVDPESVIEFAAAREQRRQRMRRNTSYQPTQLP